MRLKALLKMKMLPLKDPRLGLSERRLWSMGLETGDGEGERELS